MNPDSPNAPPSIVCSATLYAMFFWLIILVFLLCGCVASADRPGNGYRIVHHTEDMRGATGQFEGVIDCKDLYYRQQRIGTNVVFYSVSPSGRFALFDQGGVDALKVKVVLFDRQTFKVREVADTPEVPQSSRWREPAGVVDVFCLIEDETKHITLEH